MLRIFVFIVSLTYSILGNTFEINELNNAIGLTEEALLKKYPTSRKPSRSFKNLISKNLHPYHAPREHTFYRLGDYYIVFELKDGRVISVHKVSG